MLFSSLVVACTLIYDPRLRLVFVGSDKVDPDRSHMIIALGPDEETCQRLYKVADGFLSAAETVAAEAKMIAAA